MPFCTLLLFASLFCGPASAKDESGNELRLKIADIGRSGTLTIQISNYSKEPIRIWEDANSWGAARWRVLLLRRGQLETFFENPNRIFTVNFPSFETIAAGASLERKLDLNGGNWCGLGHCSSYSQRGFGDKNASFERGDTLIVIYDVPGTHEAGNMGVWFGVTAASTTVQ
jgi:hypothetical protein